MTNTTRVLLLLCCGYLAACSSVQMEGGSGSGSGGRYKVGDPYQINGRWYYPTEDYSYDETGIASWYGADFHGRKTANGEIYNMDELTAAHRTLPMPSLARVTNLENGKSIVVRVNDRGPFSKARIIDLSKRAAQLLDYELQGTARVRVQVLADESKAIADAMRQYGSSKPTQLASANIRGGEVVRSALPDPSLESARIERVVTTPETHAALLKTKPVEQVIQLPVKATTQLYVQAGAFSHQDNALKLQQKLKSLGKTEVTSVVVHGTTFYRVRLGPLASVDRADAMLAKVGKMGVGSPKIIVD